MCFDSPRKSSCIVRIVSAGVLLACLLVAMPAMAQRYQWNSDRPDGHAPAGVKADFTLPVGEIYVGYRYFEEKFRGALVGTVEFTSEEVLDFFTVATPTYDRAVHEVELRFGVTDWGTLEASMPFLRNDMLKETSLALFQTTSDVLGCQRSGVVPPPRDGRVSAEPYPRRHGADGKTREVRSHRHRDWGPTLCDAGRLR